MSFRQNPGRPVGLLYLLVSIQGALALVYVPSNLIVHGNATATASNIAASETLFRAGIACNLISQILFIWVALALYDLLKGVNQRNALLIVASQKFSGAFGSFHSDCSCTDRDSCRAFWGSC